MTLVNALLFSLVLLLQLASVQSLKQPTKVVIAGASSSVGYLVFQKLLRKSKSFFPVGIVKDKKAFRQLEKLGVPADQLRICDITRKGDLHGALDGAKKVVICTSAVPKRRLRSRIGSFFRGLVGKATTPGTDAFFYEKGQRPYEVDYLGQKNIVDECRKAGVEHVVLLGNMGGYRGSKLNDIGRKKDDPDIKNGNMLKWKRAAERYLMKRCAFTILHAGQFTDEPGGQKDIIWDTDDALLRTKAYRRIAREDAAEMIVQALIWKEAINRSIDIANKPRSNPPVSSSDDEVRKSKDSSRKGAVGSADTEAGAADAGKAGPDTDASAPSQQTGLQGTSDWLRFWSKPGDCVYPADFDDMQFH